MIARKLIDISEEVTPYFFDKYQKGQVLIFTTEDGKETHLKIVRLNKAKQKVLCEEVKLITKEELEQKLGERQAKKLKKGGE